MDFSSVPVYLDHPNWHQLQQSNPQQGSVSENSQLQPPPPPPQVGGGGGGGSIRPGSMVDRARLAKIPQPEAGLKCPRCDSTNTKFCYFNNYNLTQPRHFCKTCRRYWTRGGALRNVPVGGGCRRNKRSKNNSSKSQVTAEQKTRPKSTSVSPSSCSTDISGHCAQPSPQLPFMAALTNLGQYSGGNIGSDIAGFPTQTVATGGAGFQMGSNLGGSSNILSAGGADQWRLPFLAGREPPTNYLYPYQSQDVEARSSVTRGSQLGSVALNSGISHLAPVIMEENQGLNLSRQFMNISENNQSWSGNRWTEFSGVDSPSTSHLL